MVQGDAYSIDVEITNEGQALSPSAVSLVEIALLNLVKTYPGDVTFSDGKFHFPLPHDAAGGLDAQALAGCDQRAHAHHLRRSTWQIRITLTALK